MDGLVKRGHTSRLIVIFCLWKALLLTLAVLCPGPGYDTSALILLEPTLKRHQRFPSFSTYDRLALNVFRWDAAYFVMAAGRDKAYEQEWAFSWPYSKLLSLIARWCAAGSTEADTRSFVVAGVLSSTLCHLLSVFVLYRLLVIILDSQHRHQVAFVGAILHALSPASLFLSAPYAEALFSLLNLAGMLHYAQSRSMARTEPPSIWEDAYKLSSGLCFGAATLMRSNGLLSGLVLLFDVARYGPRVVSMRLAVHDVRRIIVTSVAGSFVALGFIWPQSLAYAEFCTSGNNLETRPWCTRTVPSIYSWVQSHYWNVGLFRYWTFPNLPLFLMAAPMLWLLLESSVTVLRSYFQPLRHGCFVPQTGVTGNSKNTPLVMHLFPELAIPQLVLAIAAITSFHVQIVNRIASGYPTWYAMIAVWIVDGSFRNLKYQRRSHWVVRGMIMYGLVQGMLFANFLPPA